MIRVYVLGDATVAHSDGLLYSRVREQQVDGSAETECAHGLALDVPCSQCRKEGSHVRIVRVRGIAA